MRIAVPKEINDTNLIAHNIDEYEFLQYSPDKYYVENEYCIRNHYIYQALKGFSVENIKEWSDKDQFMPGNLCRVTDDGKIYRAVLGVIPSDYLEWNGALHYLVDQYCKISSIKQVFKAVQGEDPNKFVEWTAAIIATPIGVAGVSSLSEGFFNSGDYCKVSSVGIVYKSLKNNNNQHYPPGNLTGIDPYWSVAGYLNIGCPPDISIQFSEWSADAMNEVGAKVKVSAAKTVFECLVPNVGCNPVDNLLGPVPKWKKIDDYNHYQSSPALWSYYGSINEGFKPSDNLTGDNPAWEEYGVINFGMDPEIYMYGTDALWAKIGPTNAWKMFDGEVTSRTLGKRCNDLTNETTISYSVQTVTAMNCIAFFDTVATRISLQLRRPDGTVIWSEVVRITKNVSSGPSDYFFSEKFPSPENLFRMFPAVPGAILDVEIYSPSTCECGLSQVCRAKYLGETQLGAKISILDYSEESTTVYGITSLSKGPSTKELTCSIEVENSVVDAIVSWVNAVRATRLVVIADNSIGSDIQFQSLMLYCYYTDMSVTFANQTITTCALEAKGLI